MRALRCATASVMDLIAHDLWTAHPTPMSARVSAQSPAHGRLRRPWTYCAAVRADIRFFRCAAAGAYLLVERAGSAWWDPTTNPTTAVHCA